MPVQITPENTPEQDTTTPDAPAFVVENRDGSVTVDPVKLAESKAADTKPTAERPAGLPEGFDSIEALAEAYAKLSKPAEPEQPTTPVKITPATDATEAAKAAGVDLSAVATEFLRDGKLSDATYTDLASKGLTRATVDTHIAGLQAQAAAQRATLANAVGGEESLAALMAWAGGSLTAAEIQTYNTALASQDVGVAQLALEGLSAKMERALGSEPRRINGGSVAAKGDAPFASQAEALTAMKDKRYNNDTAYTAKVDARLAVSDVFRVAHS